jgi:DnaK suppressor protein
MPSRKDKREPSGAKSVPDKARGETPPVEEAEVAADPAAGRLAKVPKGGPTKADLKRYRALLLEVRREAMKSSRNLADEALKASGQDFSVDHMADHGTDNFDQDFSLSLLEGESELVRDIDDAIAKIDGRLDLPYGLCETCAEELEERGQSSTPDPWIAKGRLDALPYARLCVPHQEREEESAAG